VTELAPDPERWPAGDERTVLTSFLGYYRTILIRKAEGLDDEQLRRVVEPSEMSLLGLIRHMTDVERSWFRRRMSGAGEEGAPPLYYGDHDPDGDFHPGPDDTLADALAALRAEIAFAESVVASAGSLDDLAAWTRPHPRIPGWNPNLRWILVHMIEEYARHCGHADLIRERIDGSVGD
jgi:hypothetical protein